MAGLDNIPKYEDGGEVVVTPANIKGQPTVAGKVPLDPTETANILNQMQKLIDERTSPMSQFLGGLKDATAWTAGGAQGPTAALAERDRQKELEQQQLQSMQSQMATYRSAAAQNEIAKKQLEGLVGGSATIPGVTGTSAQHAKLMNDPNIKLRMDALPAWDYQGKLAILSDAAKTEFGNISKSRSEAASNTPQDYMIPGVGPMRMTPNQFNDLPEDVKKRIEVETLKQFGKLPGAAVTGTATAPSAATGTQTIMPNGNAAARVAGNESGANPNVGYHDLSKSSAYGTYGITKGAYQDIQAANPKFKNRDITTLTPAEQTEAFNTYRQLSGNRLSQLGVETNAQNLDLAHFLGADGAARYLKSGIISDAAAAANGGKDKVNAIAQGILSGKQVAASPAAGQQTAPLPPHPSTIKPVAPIGAATPPAVNEWDDNTKMLPKNEWDDNTRMLPGQAAPAAAPAAATEISPIAKARALDPMPDPSRYGSNYEAYKNDLSAWQKREEERAKGLGTTSTETAKEETAMRNEFRSDLKDSKDAYEALQNLKKNTKGKTKIFNLSGQGIMGPIESAFVSEYVDPKDPNHLVTKNDQLAKWKLNDEEMTHYNMAKQGAAEAQAQWARNLIKGAGGRLTNADIALGGIAKGVGPEQTYSSHMQNLARQMEAAATVQLRAQAFKAWETAHPNEPVANFIESTEYANAKSKARALVAQEFADTPEAKYAFRGKKTGKLYVIKPNGESEYVE